VSIDGEEGNIRFVSVPTSSHPPHTVCNPLDSHSVQDDNTPGQAAWLGASDAMDAINDVQHGVGDPMGPPGAFELEGRAVDSVSVNLKPWQTPADPVIQGERKTMFAKVTINDSVKESDLRGYHVELAGSYYGPWRRLTTAPMAWWEDTYFIRGLGHRRADDSDSRTAPEDWVIYTGHPECAYVRVIAVDEEGNESAPTYAGSYSQSGIPDSLIGMDPANPWLRKTCLVSGPTPEAPEIVASTDRYAVADPFDDGAIRLDWEQIPAAVGQESLYTYYVYRMPTHYDFSRYFYLTQVVPAHSCVNGLCSYIEEGEVYWSLNEDPNADCPYGYTNSSDTTRCRGVNKTNVFYVTVKGPEGGESPRSNLVFWSSQEGWMFAGLTPRADQEAWTALADGQDLGPEPELGTCATMPAMTVAGTLGVCEEPERMQTLTARAEQPALAPFKTLGQAAPGPPFKLIDLHVDHLGSTRVTTNDAAQVVSVHDYLPFGEEIAPIASDNTKMFTGHERDRESGLDYMLARYHSGQLARFLSTDPAAISRRNLRFPERWNRYSYTLNNPLKYVDLDGRDVTVAANARADVAYAYQHSATFRTQFDAAKNNPDVNVTITKKRKVKEGRAKVDLAVTVKATEHSSSGEVTVLRAAVDATVAIPEQRGGDPVLGVEAAALVGHELAHVNNCANGTDTAAEAADHSGPAEERAAAVEQDVKDDLETEDDDISQEETAKALEGTEPKKGK